MIPDYPSPQHQIKAFMEFSVHRGDELRWILEITIHYNHIFTLRRLQTRSYRNMLPKITT